ncbi:UDP-glucuronosyltransferase 2A3-like [Neodiprion lecontei]|uniref:UDP-glucuronosyltransferase 2A3-like n=1 Tax=Neodiprion lecontei TaxID=441921 RepID=A0ABM3GNY8_NEOLC|nr:UDP-glucuronosyltransferase 2A3-like [Neodiprion lecontei]
MALTTQQQYGTGNPIIHSDPSHWESGIDALDNPTFWQILCNLIKTWRYLYWYKTTYMQKQQEIARKYFGNDIPDLGELEKKSHPNIKAFIYQVGLQSTEEAIFHAVPLIGLPVFSDQQTDVQKMVSLGVGKKLNIFNIDRFDLVKAIQSVAGDGSYKQRLLKLRDLMEDKPYDSLENAVR